MTALQEAKFDSPDLGAGNTLDLVCKQCGQSSAGVAKAVGG